MDSYETIAEISVAVVGFVAIVTALSKRASTEFEKVLTKNVLFEPIAVVMFALLPSLISGSGLDGDLSIKTSLTLFALSHLYLCYWVYARFKPYLGREFPKSFFLIVNSTAAGLCFIQLLAVAGLIHISLHFLYHLGLYWLLGMCFLNFVMLFIGEDRDNT